MTVAMVVLIERMNPIGSSLGQRFVVPLYRLRRGLEAEWLCSVASVLKC